MKAVIMAAGKGTRMLPLTKNTPKVLIKINRKPFLYYLFNNLIEAGFDEIAVVVGYMKEKFPAFLKEYGFKAELIEQGEQKGTGHAVKTAKQFAGKDRFIALGGDNLWSADDLREMAKADEFCYVAGIRVENPQQYGVLIEENGKLAEIIEKPKKFVGDLVNTGLYRFTPEIFDALEKIKISERGEYEITDAISIIAGKGKARVMRIKDYWIDLGSIEDVPKAEKFISALGK